MLKSSLIIYLVVGEEAHTYVHACVPSTPPGASVGGNPLHLPDTCDRYDRQEFLVLVVQACLPRPYIFQGICVSPLISRYFGYPYPSMPYIDGWCLGHQRFKSRTTRPKPNSTMNVSFHPRHFHWLP
ncbi:hypothetical protein F4778DRAFT_728636 [Xylariomycetidae sp. FL2044]|nr:hypothetical protein F4778DRAFT_728636 [Xylariomycetidae sp. FL2044]